MKFKFYTLLVLFLAVFIALTSCENEITDVTLPDAQQTIAPSSELALLMSMASANSGAYDNVLDNSSCFSIELPVTIVVSDIVIVIENLEDLEALEDLFEEFEDEEDFLDFVFPITIIFNDYSEIVIANEEELENFISDCDDDDFDDVIECIDFVYPISFSVFNSAFDIIDTLVIENDQALYNFIEGLEDNDNALIVSLNYPVTMVYANDETVEVNSNQELAEVINAAGDDCDDNDIEDCNEQAIAANLTECLWEIDDTLNDFDDFYLDFNEDGSLQLIVGATTQFVEGNWELVSTDDGLVIRVTNLTDFQQDLEGDWLIVDCDDDDLEIVKGSLIFDLDQECENTSDCDPSALVSNLLLCEWDLETYSNFPVFEDLDLEFFENGTFVLHNSGDATDIEGTWSVNVTGGGTVLTLITQTTDFGGEWLLIECDEDDDYQYTFQNGNQIMVIEKDCEDDNNGLFECFDSFDAELVVCDNGTDGPYEFDLTVVFANCQADAINYFETLADAENFVNPIANPQSYSVVDTNVTIYAKVEINDQFEIFVIDLSIEDCGDNSCSEEAIEDYLQTCEWIPVSFNGDDNLIEYTIVFDSQTLVVEVNGMIYTTTYSVEGTNPTFVFINGFANMPLDDLTGDWTVISCEPNRLELQRNNDILVLEQSCD